MKYQEIGSEFHIEGLAENRNKHIKNVFGYLQEYNTVYFDSGRSALRAVMNNFNTQKVLLPDYLCESVRNCFSESNVTYYHIDNEFHIDWEDMLKKCKSGIDVLYLHYFNGYIGNEYDFKKLWNLKRESSFMIVEDTTHSFLSCKHTVGDYCICSLRKWFPIPDGGVLYSNRLLDTRDYKKNSWYLAKRIAMVKKGLYLEGHNIDKNDFLPIFAETEEILDSQTEPFAMSDDSCNILKNISINEAAEVRCKNYSVLSQFLNSNGIKTAAGGGALQVPLFCTICVDDRDSLRKYLIENKIYCPVHWPLYSELKQRKGSVHNNARELSIPIDQRYGLEDILYISAVIQKYNEKVYGNTRRIK